MKFLWMYNAEFQKELGTDVIDYYYFALDTDSPTEAIKRIAAFAERRGYKRIRQFHGPNGQVWTE